MSIRDMQGRNAEKMRKETAKILETPPHKIMKPASSKATEPSDHPHAHPAPRIVSGDENWDQRLGFLMHDISRLRRRIFDEFMRPLGVTRSQWWVMAYLSRYNGLSQSDLASTLELGRASLGGLLDRLELTGYIERRSDPSDRRIKKIFLSPMGNQMIKEMSARSHEMSERILEGLSTADRLQLADLLMTVKQNLNRVRDEIQGRG